MDAVARTEAVVAVPLVLKATPKVEGGERIIYCEPSTEETDLEGERVLRRALIESQEYFLAKGNFDLDHKSLLGYAQGLENPRQYEIGRPLAVRVDEGGLFVKGFIYQGAGPMAKQANEFWSSLTELQPPMRWYPSVGGHVREAGTILPKGASAPVRAITQVSWTNIAFSREPINPTVPGVSLLPIGAFAKAWIGVGSTLDYEPVALNTTRTAEPLPLQGAVKLGKDLLRGTVRKRGPTLQVEDLITHLVEAGMPRAQAKAAVAQFLTARATRRTIA